jgi:acyl carrier protein
MDNAEQVRTAATHADIVEALCVELRKLDPQGGPLSEATDITTDLNIDSVAVMDLLFALEERYDVSIPLNELDDVRTVGQLAGVISQRVNRS